MMITSNRERLALKTILSQLSILPGNLDSRGNIQQLYLCLMKH